MSSGEAKLRRVLFALIVFGLMGSSVVAQDRKGIRFWNLTLYTITSLQMSPAGKDSWGPDQCKNDRDGTADHDERLRITGIEPGRYDVKLADNIGRICIVRNVEVKQGAVFINRGKAPHRLPQVEAAAPLECVSGPSELETRSRYDRPCEPKAFAGQRSILRPDTRPQAASLPEALATWVAIASIKAGD